LGVVVRHCTPNHFAEMSTFYIILIVIILATLIGFIVYEIYKPKPKSDDLAGLGSLISVVAAIL
jgi:hypothetical protein